MLHEIENNEDTKSFLKENGKKLSNDCIKAMELMYKSIRLNGNTCKQLYDIHDRRLRDCCAARPDVVKKAWKKDSNGKRLYVEYWIDVPPSPTKAAAIKQGEEILARLNSGELKQGEMFK